MIPRRPQALHVLHNTCLDIYNNVNAMYYLNSRSAYTAQSSRPI
jgi:hypothetical protein